jgi:hypothetical protein
METLVTWRADQGTAKAHQRTRHETIGALDGFAQQPQGSLTRWIALRGGTIFFLVLLLRAPISGS